MSCASKSLQYRLSHLQSFIVLRPLISHNPHGARAQAIMAPIRACPTVPVCGSQRQPHSTLRTTFVPGFFPEFLAEVLRAWEDISGNDRVGRNLGLDGVLGKVRSGAVRLYL